LDGGLLAVDQKLAASLSTGAFDRAPQGRELSVREGLTRIIVDWSVPWGGAPGYMIRDCDRIYGGPDVSSRCYRPNRRGYSAPSNPQPGCDLRRTHPGRWRFDMARLYPERPKENQHRSCFGQR